MNVTGKQLVEKAREYLGTPFHHQGRCKGIGVDCAGLIVCSARELGIDVVDSPTYSRLPDGRTLQACIERCMVEVPLEQARDGDMLVFRMVRYPSHVGLKTDKGFIHTYSGVGRVVEHGYVEPWVSRTVAAYRFKGM